MTTQHGSGKTVFLFALWCMAISWVSAALYAFLDLESARAVSGSVGFMAALIGCVVGLWFSFRGKDRRLGLVAACSMVALIYWGMILYPLVHGKHP